MNACGFACTQCPHKWQQLGGARHEGCPACGCLYVRWTNFEAWREEQCRIDPEHRKVAFGAA